MLPVATPFAFPSPRRFLGLVLICPVLGICFVAAKCRDALCWCFAERRRDRA